LGLGFRVQGLWFRISGFGFIFEGVGHEAWGLGPRVSGLRGIEGGGGERNQALPLLLQTETDVESGTSQSTSETSVHSSNSGKRADDH